MTKRQGPLPGPKQTIPIRLIEGSEGQIGKFVPLWGDRWITPRYAAPHVSPASLPRTRRSTSHAALKLVAPSDASPAPPSPSIPVMDMTASHGYPADQGHGTMTQQREDARTHPVHHSPTTSPHLPDSRVSTSTSAHGQHGTAHSSQNSSLLAPERAISHTQSVHSAQHSTSSGLQHGAPVDPVSQKDDDRRGYVATQVNRAQPNGALPTDGAYGVVSGAQAGTSPEAGLASTASTPLDPTVACALIWWQGATENLRLPPTASGARGTAAAGRDAHSANAYPAQAGPSAGPSHGGRGADDTHGPAPQHPNCGWCATHHANNAHWD